MVPYSSIKRYLKTDKKMIDGKNDDNDNNYRRILTEK